nr:hypothetical protein [Angustibacter aerolatus]
MQAEGGAGVRRAGAARLRPHHPARRLAGRRRAEGVRAPAGRVPRRLRPARGHRGPRW